jgi:hypothetical protein
MDNLYKLHKLLLVRTCQESTFGAGNSAFCAVSNSLFKTSPHLLCTSAKWILHWHCSILLKFQMSCAKENNQTVNALVHMLNLSERNMLRIRDADRCSSCSSSRRSRSRRADISFSNAVAKVAKSGILNCQTWCHFYNYKLNWLVRLQKCKQRKQFQPERPWSITLDTRNKRN